MIEIRKTFSPDGMLRLDYLTGVAFSRESGAHRFIISGPEAFTGTVTASFMRADGQCVIVTGSLDEDGRAVVTADEDCYLVPGRMLITVYLTGEDSKVCIYAGLATVYDDRGSGEAPSGETTRTIEEMLEEILEGVDNAQQLLDDAGELLDDVTAEGATQVAAVQAKGDQVIASIPSDYSALTGDVSSLKSAFNNLVDLSITWTDGFYTPSHQFNDNASYQHTNYISIKDLAIPIHYHLRVIYTVPSYILFDNNYNYIDQKSTSSESTVIVDGIVSDYKGASYIVFETLKPGFTDFVPIIEYTDLPNTQINGFLKEITADDIPNDIISQEKLTFAEKFLPANLFDYQSADMCKTGYWYYGTTIGMTIEAVSNEFTDLYAALKIPIFDLEKITVGAYPNTPTKKIYWIGAVDGDMKLLHYSTVNQDVPVTYSIPAGAVYVLVSYNIGTNDFVTYLPKVMAVNGETISGYSPYFPPYYLLKNCQVDVSGEENTVTLKLPDVYDAVVNDTIQIFFKGIVNSANPEMYYVDVECSQGNLFERYFELTPTSTGNITATFTLYGINHNILDTKSVTFAVHAKPSNPSAQKNILCVGDSLTNGGEWVTELHRRLTGSGGTPAGDGLTNFNFIGTREKNGVHFEGYGGWTFNSYNTENVGTNVKIITCSHDKTSADQHSIYKDSANYQWKLETIEEGQIKIIAVTGTGASFPATGTLTWVSGGVNHSSIVYTASENGPGNPFWYSDGVDFSAYATDQGVSSIDYVLVLLGWNNASTSEADYKAAAQTFITNVHADFPNAKIILLGLEIPARNGLGVNYNASSRYGHYYNLMQFVFNMDSWYADLAGGNSNTYSANLSGQFDTEYNMPTTQRQVNIRNSETVVFQSNGVHPATPGYYQIADAFYRALVGTIN